MPRWIGLIGSWALLVLGVGLFAIAAAAEAINLRDEQKYLKYELIDRMIEEWKDERVDAIREGVAQSREQAEQLEAKVQSTEGKIRDLHDSDRVIVVSTAENRVYLRDQGNVVFEGVCSTGKGTTLRHAGRTMVFRTPIGKFRIRSKETDPKWIPPDWHYVEYANERGLEVVRLDYGETLGTGSRLLRVAGKDVVEVSGGYTRPFPPGQEIVAGGAVIIPPVGTHQREYADVLGTHRLNLGDGYALHGTQAVSQLGRSVSHGCIRLSNDDIAKLYSMVEVGDEVIIY